LMGFSEVLSSFFVGLQAVNIAIATTVGVSIFLLNIVENVVNYCSFRKINSL